MLRRPHFLSAVLVLLLAGCAVPPPSPTLPELTFAHLDPIRLDVGKIEIVDEYVPPLKAPNVEHEFPVAPAEAAQRWGRDRIIAAGTSGVARIVIRNAGVIEVPLEKTAGLTGLITVDQAARYDGTLEMLIEIRSDRGTQEAFVRAFANRSQSVPEDITLNERQAVFYELTEGLIGDLNAELERNIRQHLARYLL